MSAAGCAPLTDPPAESARARGRHALIEIVLCAGSPRRRARGGRQHVPPRPTSSSRICATRPHDDLRIAISRETELLDTGVRLEERRMVLRRRPPLPPHNADVVSGVDLRGMVATRQPRKALAVLSGSASRAHADQFLFDGRRPAGRLGAPSKAAGATGRTGPVADATRWRFDGIQVLAPETLQARRVRGFPACAART